MTLRNWQTRHQTHVLCGRTAFGTESNEVPNQYGPHTRCGLDTGVAETKGAPMLLQSREAFMAGSNALKHSFRYLR